MNIGTIGRGNAMRGYVPLTIHIDTVESYTPWFRRWCELCPDARQFQNRKSRQNFDQLVETLRSGRKRSGKPVIDRIIAAKDRVVFEEEHNLSADDWDDHASTLFAITYGYRYETRMGLV